MAEQSKGKFSEFIQTCARGALDDDATAQLHELVMEMTRIAETGGGKPKGKLTLTVELVLDRGIIDVNPKLIVTRPNPVRARSIMYPTADGRLTHQDEKQGRLALEGEVRDLTPDVKDIRTARS